MSDGETWYHGSPYELTALRAGSTITRDREVARVFSHKPPLVSIGDDGQIQHTGTLPGYLYRIDEPVGPEDVYPHPRTTMAPGVEWLTRRDLRLALLGRTAVREEERLSEAELEALRRRAEEPSGSRDSGS
jgi:hypothetical protein